MEKSRFPEWEKLYQDEKVETMPWYYQELDHDLKMALQELDINTGRALDLGTGPGTQAAALAEMGFTVTATDISATAVKKADLFYRNKGLHIEFIEDDILQSNLKGPFDLVFDRGCFHVLEPSRRIEYMNTVGGLIREGGYLLLKCFSNKETMPEGPYRFTPDEIREIFRSRFDILHIHESEFRGTLEIFPIALFCTLRRK